MFGYILAIVLISSSLLVTAQDLDCRRHPSDLECSGRGVCSGGQCQCFPRFGPVDKIYGKYCECDNFSCERYNGESCTGPDHGTCECGQCVCQPNWGGSDCSRYVSTEGCKQAADKEVCSGRGLCTFGDGCRCETPAVGHYGGKFCENYYVKGRCDEFEDCVACQMYKAGPLKHDYDCMANCTQFTPISMERIEIDEDHGEQLCIIRHNDDCKFKFKYSERDGRLSVYAMHEMECRPPQQQLRNKY